MRVAHEAPLSIMRRVQSVTDYDYALVHLFEEIPEYYNFFKEAIERGRYVILDNSIFELGEAFDADRFAHYVQELKPTAYIVPDALEDINTTISNFNSWCEKYGDLPGEKIGVVQGKTYEEIVDCYQFMVQYADKVAISFDYSLFESYFPDEPTKYHAWVKGRQHLLTMMVNAGIINTNKPHHLLGAGLPQEFAYYKNWDWIDTIDTSNPVVHGINGITYEKMDYGLYGLQDKVSTKLYTMMNEDVANIDKVLYNIGMFKENILPR